jgi:hypothetical protein
MSTSRAQSVRILNLICTVEGSAYFSRCPPSNAGTKHLDNPQSLQAYMALLVDDQIIMDRELERPTHSDDLMAE